MTFLEMTLSGAVFILAAAAVRALALRRLPKETFVALWWAAALRLLIPVELPSRLSVYTLLEALRSKPAPVPVAPAAAWPAPSQVLIIPAQPPAAPQPAPEPFPVWTSFWAVGAGLLALWFLIRYVRWRRRFRESVPADCPGLDTCLRCRRRVRLRVTDRIAAPLTYGLFRPVILLPKTLDLRDEAAVTCVLAHEMAHIRRLDGLFKLVLTAALCLHWFNPAVWLLYVLANRDMELRCDEAAVLALGEDSRERYALALIRLAELQNDYVPLCGFSQKSGMEERIRAIMSIRKQSLLACFIALALVLGITTAFATSAKPEEEPPVKTRDEVLTGDAAAVKALVDSVRYDSGNLYFTIPEGEGVWSIFIQGRIMTEDGMGMSVRYLEKESERAEWVPRMTYAFEAADAAYDELTMDVRYGSTSYFYDLTLLLPEGRKPLAVEPLPEGKADIPEGAEMVWPVDGGAVTQARQTRTNPETGGTAVHDGVDIAAEKGTPIYAAGRGTVKEAGYNAKDGYFVRLDHGAGQESFYAHCQKLLVKTGDEVLSGQTIATVGSTGMSTGPHLHFEILVNGESQDPLRYFEKAGVPEVQPSDVLWASGAGADSASDALKYYEAGSLPMFQISFSRLSEKEQSAWLDKIYADGETAFFSVSLDVMDSSSSLIDSFAEKVYQGGSISFFSVLTDRMSEKTLNTWLDRAVKDKKTSFQSVLLDKLEKEDELEALEEKLAERQLEEYRKAGVTKNGKDYYYQGKLVNIFLDLRPDNSCYTLDMNPAGEINIKIIRGADGEITGIGYITDSEFEELFGESA